MPRPSLQHLGPVIIEAGHGLFLPIVGVAMLCGKVVGCAQTPANVVIASAFIITGLLMPLNAFGLLPRVWTRAMWAMFVAAVIAFVAVNLF